MGITSSRNLQVQFSGDFTGNIIQSALDNSSSPGEVQIVRLASGNNTISLSAVTGIVPTALVIIPPAGNATLITLKGVNGDTGIPLHKTDPMTVSLDSTFTSLVLNAAAQIDGVKLIWT